MISLRTEAPNAFKYIYRLMRFMCVVSCPVCTYIRSLDFITWTIRKKGGWWFTLNSGILVSSRKESFGVYNTNNYFQIVRAISSGNTVILPGLTNGWGRFNHTSGSHIVIALTWLTVSVRWRTIGTASFASNAERSLDSVGSILHAGLFHRKLNPAAGSWMER